ncbi:MAG: STAS domain-containing protein [Planctomycetes bacterium]|nr:STAS domain-containing protein [Planctomycetota bacterium]
MEIVTEKNEKAIVVSMKGRLDAVTAPELEKNINNFIKEEEYCFVINCEDLNYISSAGLRVVLIIAKKLKSVNGQMLISNLKGVVKEVFDISGFTSILQIYETENEALKQI